MKHEKLIKMFGNTPFYYSDFAFTYDETTQKWKVFTGLKMPTIPQAQGKQFFFFLGADTYNYFFLPSAPEEIPFNANTLYYSANEKTLYYVQCDTSTPLPSQLKKWEVVSVGLSPHEKKAYIEFPGKINIQNYDVYKIQKKVGVEATEVLRLLDKFIIDDTYHSKNAFDAAPNYSGEANKKSVVKETLLDEPQTKMKSEETMQSKIDLLFQKACNLNIINPSEVLMDENDVLSLDELLAKIHRQEVQQNDNGSELNTASIVVTELEQPAAIPSHSTCLTVGLVEASTINPDNM